MSAAKTITCEFRMLLEKSTGVHHGYLHALPVIAQCIGRRSLHGFKAPVLFVLVRLPRLLGSFEISIRCGNLPLFHIGCRCRTGTEHESCDSQRYNALGGLGLARMLFVGNDVLLMSHAPLGLENAIHLLSPNKWFVWSCLSRNDEKVHLPDYPAPPRNLI